MRTGIMVALAAGCLAASCSRSSGPAPEPGSGTIRELAPAATGGELFSGPLDATLSPDGKTAFFIALTPEGGPGIFRSAAPADGPPELLASGAPLTAPFGLDVTADGETLVIADPGAQVDAGGEAPGEDRGQLLTVPTGGGSASILAGASGYVPRGVVVMPGSGGGGDQITFTGATPGENEPGVFRVSIGGGEITTLAKGAPFTDPSGVAVGASGQVFVVDTAGDESDRARLIQVEGGAATVLLDGMAVGFPAGVALTPDDRTVLISALDPDRRTDLVLLYDLQSRELTRIASGIESFSEPAGLHRAKNADTYIWADSSANGGGTVFVINPQP
jgi:DNA-binding beta-propeller fold protein YncE